MVTWLPWAHKLVMATDPTGPVPGFLSGVVIETQILMPQTPLYIGGGTEYFPSPSK